MMQSTPFETTRAMRANLRSQAGGDFRGVATGTSAGALNSFGISLAGEMQFWEP